MRKPRSWTSVTLLQQRCRAWFLETGHPEPFFPGRWCDTSIPDEGLKGQKPVQDVVLFGDFAAQILRAEKWRGQAFRIWVLSTAAKEVSCQLLGLPRNAVGIIPRTALYPVRAKPEAKPGPKSEWTLLYAGRLSLSKNFDFCVRIASLLQTEFGHRHMRFVAYGQPDLMACQDLGRRADAFPEILEALVQRLPWIHRPEFRGNVAHDHWPSAKLKRPVFISCSNYIMEDFGVSLAQAQQQGWPCIVSDWGGHRDVQGANVLKIPAISVGRANEPEAFIEGRAWACARDIHEWLQAGPESPALQTSHSNALQSLSPRQLSRAELAAIRRRATHTFSKKVLLLTRSEGIVTFAKTQHGQNFFSRYRDLFAGPLPKQVDETLVVTPAGRLSWLSMQEIVPSLERAWAASARGNQRIVRILPVTNKSFGKTLREFLAFSGAGRVVFTILGDETLGMLPLLRSFLGARIPVLLHMHGEPTSACLGFQAATKHLNSRDTFLVSCEADRKALRLCYPKARIRVVPFPLPVPSKPSEPIMKRYSSPARLVYSGRISEQKNLHTLLAALWLLKRAKPRKRLRLEIFGSDDQLGSPNMGMRSRGYGTYLKRLTLKLGLNDQVCWRGFVDRAKLQQELSRRPHIFVSASLHSDENFGAAAFLSLALGQRAVLTAWGGHLDFAKLFGQQVTMVAVRGNTTGPFISPMDLARAILAADASPIPPRPSAALANYFLSSTVKRLQAASLKPSTIHSVRTARAVQIDQSDNLAQLLHRRRARSFQGNKVFTGYDDRQARLFFTAYGMHAIRRTVGSGIPWIPPWVCLGSNALMVRDPHRGCFRVDRGIARHGPMAFVHDSFGHKLPIGKKTLDWLLENGYAF